MPRSVTLLAILFALLLAPAALAQARMDGRPAGALDAEARRAAVARIAQLLDERYVFQDVGREAGAFVTAQMEAGAYDDLTGVDAFAERLTADLQSISHDGHMRVRPVPPAEAAGDPTTAMAAARRRMRAENYGFYRVERLEGNVGYLDLRGFAPVEEARETAAAAMRFLANVDALIVDLRQNGGGSPAMVQFLCSYLFDTPTHLNSLYWREGDRTEEFWTLDDLPGPRLADVPVFVLTARRTFSGAEEFAYNLRTRERATLVGETTGGGANPGGFMPVSDQLGIFVPTGRAINPVTGTNWEGTGVEPHVAVPAEEAFDRALALAREAAEAYRAERFAAEDAARAALNEGLRAAESAEGTAKDRAVAEALRAALDAGVADEFVINGLGYRYLGAGDTAMAIAVFRFNVEAFPDSFNTYDSLEEAYMEAGQRDLAIANYERSLELNPDNENGRMMLARLRGE
ncbi:MAG TPA: S41 family peptidase [Rubricoccaceae bacterium]|nr:S41 family peptidase [Rubricoccaceae bacterium]